MTGFTTIQFFPLPELRNRANNVGDNVKSIKIYSGDMGKKGSLAFEIRRDNSGAFPGSAFDYFEGKYNGSYTAIFSPGGETMYLESQGNSNGQHSNNGQYNLMNGAGLPGYQYKDYHPGQFIQKILELEKKNAELQQLSDMLQEELKQFNTLSGKFQHAFAGLLENTLLPLWSGNNSQYLTTPMQGINNNTMEEWRTKKIDVSSVETAAEDAAQIVHDALGVELLVRVAQKLQQDPSLIQKISMFI